MDERILWIIFIVLFLLSGIRRKKRASQEQAPQTGERGILGRLEELLKEEMNKEAWPEIEPIEAPAPAPRPTNAPQYNKVTPQTPHKKAHQATREPHQYTPQPAAGRPAPQVTKATQTAENCPSGHPGAANSLTAEQLREEFDLQRAVLYSEILRPKFEEYE